MNVRGVDWQVLAAVPSPCPLPQAGEGKRHAINLMRPVLPQAAPSPHPQAALPPLPLAGEGWGEGTLEATPRGCSRAHLPSAAAFHRSRTASRETLRAPVPASARDPQATAPHAAHHQARRPTAHADRRNPRCNAQATPVGGIDSRPDAGCGRIATGSFPRRWNPGVVRVRSRAMGAWRKISLTLPSPASGRGESTCQRSAARDVGNARNRNAAPMKAERR